MMLVDICGKGATRNRRYKRVRTRWLIRRSIHRPQPEQESVFYYLTGKVEIAPRPATAQVHWILGETCWLADRSTSLWRAAREGNTEVRRATMNFQRATQEDQRRKVNKTVEEVELLMSAGNTRESWRRVLWWYLKAKGHKNPPSRGDLNQLSAEREELYRCQLP